MSRLTLCLAFHNHQPDGNFDHVFGHAYDDCYRPLLDTLAEHPRVRVALHHTGPLLEWLEKNRPAYLADLRRLVERKQVELLGGGFYEPMLAVLPDADAQGQMRLMSDYCEERLGMRPRGMWLAERVWEPALAETIGRAGLSYTLLDDTHFRYAGIDGQLEGYYVTEKAGTPLALFPIAKELRYAIPFTPIDRTMEVLDELRRSGSDRVVTYGDDGEKFGLWPHTKEWVWEKGWLRQFFARLSESETVETSTFSDVLDRTRPTGRVYLPTASYEEMGAWTLPAQAQERYEDVRARLEHEGRFEDVRPFFRGGVWQSFLAKYAEANLMHKKMIYVSRRVASSGNEHARRELYRGQCNCAYWHGLFGGLYLNYLRHAVYSHLIEAEAATDGDRAGARVERIDFDADMVDELIISTRELWVGIKPDAGGATFEIDLRKQRFNLANVLGRHPEGYHRKLREAAQQSAAHHGDQPKSIHDLATVKEAGLEELLHYDRHLRLGFVDHFLAPGTTLDELARSTYDDRGDFTTGAYEIRRAEQQGNDAVVELARLGQVRDAAGRQRRVHVDKTFTLSGARLSCRWRIRLAEEDATSVPAQFVPELPFTLLAGDDAGRRYELPPGAPQVLDGQRMLSRGVLPATPRIDLVDEWSRVRLVIEATSPTGAPTLWRFPLETASQSEGGFERTYQGSVVAPVWQVELSQGRVFEATLSLTLVELPRA